jgi:hypothetical protein
MSDNLASDLRGWAKSGLTRDLYQGATPLCDTLAQAADRIDALEASLWRMEAMTMLDFANHQTAKSLRKIQAMKDPTP